jgi:hypothetical protein
MGANWHGPAQGSLPDKRKLGAQRVMIDPSSVQLCSTGHGKEAGVLWISAQPGACGIILSRDLPPFTQGTHPLQARPLQIQSSRGMDLNSPHPGDLRAAQSGSAATG